MMKASTCLTVILITGITACLSCSTTKNENIVPNIVLIMADDLGYETLSINGSTSYNTPFLDSLARSGMRFTQAYATPLCTPSRVQIMTGKYNFRNYVGFGVLDPEEQTFGHYLQDAGYSTGVFGKWQLYGDERQQKLAGQGGTLPEDAGFHEHYLWQVKSKTGPRFKDPHIVKQSSSSTPYPDAYGPDVFADSLIGFIKRHQDSPFFAYYPMVLTHDPFQPTPLQEEFSSFDSSTRLNDTTYFAANVEYMDLLIGRIVKALDELSLRENTLILFLADNGTDRDVISRFGSQSIQGHKGFPTQAGTHIPMIANWKGTIAPAQVNENLIDLTDFLPTLMEVAQLNLPEEAIVDGLSFYPQLINEADSVRSWVFCHYAPNWGRFESTRFVHDQTWKLFDDGSFYNIKQDPMQLQPLNNEQLSETALKRKESFQDVLDSMHD